MFSIFSAAARVIVYSDSFLIKMKIEIEENKEFPPKAQCKCVDYGQVYYRQRKKKKCSEI
jgi:hypothetical protein